VEAEQAHFAAMPQAQLKRAKARRGIVFSGWPSESPIGGLHSSWTRQDTSYHCYYCGSQYKWHSVQAGVSANPAAEN
jgi:hypothetical protein